MLYSALTHATCPTDPILPYLRSCYCPSWSYLNEIEFQSGRLVCVHGSSQSCRPNLGRLLVSDSFLYICYINHRYRRIVCSRRHERTPFDTAAPTIKFNCMLIAFQHSFSLPDVVTLVDGMVCSVLSYQPDNRRIYRRIWLLNILHQASILLAVQIFEHGFLILSWINVLQNSVPLIL